MFTKQIPKEVALKNSLVTVSRRRTVYLSTAALSSHRVLRNATEAANRKRKGVQKNQVCPSPEFDREINRHRTSTRAITSAIPHSEPHRTANPWTDLVQKTTWLHRVKVGKQHGPMPWRGYAAGPRQARAAGPQKWILCACVKDKNTPTSPPILQKFLDFSRDFGISLLISRDFGISVDFADFGKDFRDFGISRKISDFAGDFRISFEISAEVYEISVSGKPLG